MNQTIFTKEDCDKIDYLRFSPDFNVALNGKSKIILGANGVGKTSIYKEISKKGYHCIDYGEIQESFKNNNKNKLTIATNIKILEVKLEERKVLKDEKINIKNRIKESFGTSAKTKLKEIDSLLEKVSENLVLLNNSFTSNKFDTLRKLSEEETGFLFKNAKTIIESKSMALDIEQLKERFLQNSFENLEKYLNDEEKTCPICDTEKSQTIKEIITEKKKKLSKIGDELTKNALIFFEDKSSYGIKLFVDGIKNKILENDIEFIDIISFALDRDEKNPLKQRLKELQNTEKEISKLEKEKGDFYNLLKTEESEIKDEFVKNFEVESTDLVNFDDDKKEIEITLPRDVKKYSTGEIHLMLFIIYIYEGIASDKEIIVIDDPLSSYDIVNQYKIIYKIAFADKRKGKKLLVFTHNIDTLNIANSQHPGLCDYEYIERYNGMLHIQRIEPVSKDTFLKISQLLKKNDLQSSYIRLLINRENEGESFEGHRIFHYNEPFEFEYEGNKLENGYLANLIDSFEKDFGNFSFQDNIINKIIYLSAIRVWIEKQFYLTHPKDKDLQSKHTMTEKIDYLFPEGESPIWSGSKKATRGFLMSKKVMLNQNMHIESQRVPFEYALNLSLDDICKEIKEIKEVFNEVKNGK